MRIKSSLVAFLFAFIIFGLFSTKPAFAAAFDIYGNVQTSSGSNISGATINVKDVNMNNIVATTSSDILGNYTVNINEGTYNIEVIPPAGSDFAPAVALDRSITSDTLLDFIFAPAGQVALSGHVKDPLGNPLPNQRVSLKASGPATTVFTDNDGNYSLLVSPGSYTLTISSPPSGNGENLNAPQNYTLGTAGDSFSLNQNRTLEVTLPVKKVDIRVLENAQTPVSTVDVTVATSPGGASFSGGVIPIGPGVDSAGGYSFYNGSISTDAGGDASLWLFPNNSTFKYNFTATPYNGSIYSQFNLNNIVVSTNQSEVISLQYSHNAPVTTIALAPTPRTNGTYPSPVTVTLSATAASGYTIANILYKINNGQTQTYSVPITFSNFGDYEIEYWSTDNSGVQESHKTKTFIISEQSDPVTQTFNASSDTYVRSGVPNQNEGGGQFMRIQASGDNRSLVRFDQQTLQAIIGSSGVVLSAKLRLTITDNGNNWGTTGRTVALHRLIADWAEGNGTEADRGTGSGATWNCAIDSLIENQAKNCSGTTEWEMGQPNNPNVHPWIETASATQTITNNQTGIVEYDVTADVASFLNGTENYGWIIKKTNEGQSGMVSFATRESVSAPQLVVTYQQ